MQPVLDFLRSLGPWGPCLAALIDGLGLPNPSGPDFFLIWLAATQPNQAYLAATLTVISSVTGNLFLYWIARRGGRRYLDRKLVGPRAQKFREWYQRYGLVTIFIPAMVPIVPMPLKAFEVCAGALGVGPLPYAATFLAGRVPRYFGLAWMGREMGGHAEAWLQCHLWHFAGFAILLFAFCYFLLKFAGRRTAS